MNARVPDNQERQMLMAVSDVRTVNKIGEEALVVDECVPACFWKFEKIEGR